jgi:hypothetical protein
MYRLYFMVLYHHNTCTFVHIYTLLQTNVKIEIYVYTIMLKLSKELGISTIVATKKSD